MTSFRPPERWKKAWELANIMGYLLKDVSLVMEFVGMGHGNPRLMEWIDRLVGEMAAAEAPELVKAVRGKQVEFIRSHVLRELVLRSSEQVGKFLKWFTIYHRPVFQEGARGRGCGGASGRNFGQHIPR